jgi:hypothetical protein
VGDSFLVDFRSLDHNDDPDGLASGCLERAISFAEAKDREGPLNYGGLNWNKLGFQGLGPGGELIFRPHHRGACPGCIGWLESRARKGLPPSRSGASGKLLQAWTLFSVSADSGGGTLLVRYYLFGQVDPSCISDSCTAAAFKLPSSLLKINVRGCNDTPHIWSTTPCSPYRKGAPQFCWFL